MLFSSNTFLFLFLPTTLIGYQVLSRWGRRSVVAWLVLASLFFYGYWNPAYLLLLLGSIALNFTAARLIASQPQKTWRSALLWGAVSANLLLLFWFKYLFPVLHFALQMGWTSRDFGSVLLPLGISFFTFTQIAYLIDLSQSEEKAEDLLSYLLFVTFFPHLIAGPLVHHAEMMPQFRRAGPVRLDPEDMAVGTTWFLLGLGKKVLLADRFGPIADALYARPEHFGTEATWVGLLAYAIQLYFDFSGYSDMALGVARMFSIAFPFNFDSPYKASSIIDFWQRWHMTLTRYITLYLYNPVAMAISRRRLLRGKKVNRKSYATPGGFTQLIVVPTIFTMFLAGIWHGAGLQFVLFGLAHGVYLSVNHLWRTLVRPDARWRRLLPAQAGVVLTFACVLAGQVFFRAESVHDAVWVLGSAVGGHPGGGLDAFAGLLPARARFATEARLAWPALGFACLIFWTLPNTQQLLGQAGSRAVSSALFRSMQWRPSLPWAMAMMLLTAVTLTLLYQSTSFLYFQF